MSVLLILLCLYGTGAIAAEAPVNPAAVLPAVTFDAVTKTEKTSCECFNDLNSLIRDGRINRAEAARDLRRLLGEIRQQFYRQGGADHQRSDWVFPLAGYDSRAIGKGRHHGYFAKGYDFFSGNRHGGHPSLDIFIRDRNKDMLDDKTGKPVAVLSLTGGIVVALEKEWSKVSPLRGGRYIWIFDPSTDLLVYYAHNNELFVALGDVVKPGDRLATVGRSGFNAAKGRSPTHLHLTVLQLNNGMPMPLDVYGWLRRARSMPAML